MISFQEHPQIVCTVVYSLSALITGWNQSTLAASLLLKKKQKKQIKTSRHGCIDRSPAAVCRVRLFCLLFTFCSVTVWCVCKPAQLSDDTTFVMCKSSTGTRGKRSGSVENMDLFWCLILKRIILTVTMAIPLSGTRSQSFSSCSSRQTLPICRWH